MAGNSRWSRSTSKKGAISRWWGGALLAAGVAMTFGAASCGGSNGNTFFFLGDGLWVADQGAAQVDEFNTLQLGSGVKDVSPRKIVTNANANPTSVPTFTAPQDTVFDGETNLWVVDGGDNTTAGDGTQQVFEFTGKQLRGTHGTVNLTPAFFISSPDMIFPQFAVFDEAGNLWVSDSSADEIFKFTPQQLTAVAGQTTPALTLDTEDLNAPLGLAFDSNGDLWVANNGATGDAEDLGLLEFKAKTLAGLSGTSSVPSDAQFTSVTTGQGTPSLDAPWGLSFDSVGDLFVTNEQPDFAPSASVTSAAAAATPSIGQGTVVEFSAAQIAAATAGAAPTPVAAIVPAAIDGTASLEDPNGVVVDRRLKTLVVANDGGDADSPSLSKYNLNAIGAGGALVPNSFVAGDLTTLDEPTGLSVGAVF